MYILSLIISLLYIPQSINSIPKLNSKSCHIWFFVVCLNCVHEFYYVFLFLVCFLLWGLFWPHYMFSGISVLCPGVEPPTSCHGNMES